MKPKLFFLLLLTFSVFQITSSIATVRYVSTTGNNVSPFLSWKNASTSIQICINICVAGDTVIVANGVYSEKLDINTQIWLLGLSMDSVIINGANATPLGVVNFFTSGTMENFTVIGNGTLAPAGIYTFGANVKIRNCKVTNIKYGMSINRSTSFVENCIITNFTEVGLDDECGPDTCHSVYSDNIIISKNTSYGAIFNFGGYPTFTNNIVIEEGNTYRGVDIQYIKGAIVKNNLVSGYYSDNIRAGQVRTDTAYFENNISLNSIAPYSSSTGSRTIIRNNIAKDSYRGVQATNGTVTPDYNLFWNIQELTGGTVILGDSNIIADPMFVKDTIPRPGGTYDYHLQAYSPAIDKGNPNILDKDGTRSDIGMYGGPLGETYTYQDLAPRPPRNLIAVLDTNQILIKWNRNTEADTSYYNVYRDTVINFTIDSTKLTASISDTAILHFPPYSSSRYVYKITCVDNQGNESNPSEERVVYITSVDEYPIVVNDYLLYQNYPNPFNPSTKIGYKLKETAYVKLMVYDIKGELVSVLVNNEQAAGYYEVEFSAIGGSASGGNASHLASGIYLYRIEVIGEGKIPVYTEMKKMLMLK